jgi:dihydrofolate reductase
MRLTTTTNVSVDGVMQGLGGPDEDRSGGFERGGWAIPLLDAETGDYLNQVYGGATAFLFGRRTYEIFARSWGAMADPSTSPIAAALNSRPKYVASTSLADPQWAGTTVLRGDVATAIGDLKAHQEGTPAGARQRCPGAMAARQRPGRPARPAYLSGRHRPGHATVPRFRSGRRVGPGQLADHVRGHHHPDLSASRAPGVRKVHGRPRRRHAGRLLGSPQLIRA